MAESGNLEAVLGPEREKRFPAAVYPPVRLPEPPGSAEGEAAAGKPLAVRATGGSTAVERAIVLLLERNSAGREWGEKGPEFPWLLDARHRAVRLDALVESNNKFNIARGFSPPPSGFPVTPAPSPPARRLSAPLSHIGVCSSEKGYYSRNAEKKPL